MPITQRELLEKNFKSEAQELFSWLLRPDIYVLVGASKIGKSIVITSMANCVAHGTVF